MSEPVIAGEQALADVRVLIVDDHDLFRSGLRNLLEDEGVHVVGEASAGQDRVDHVVVLIGDRQHHHARQRRNRRDVPCRLDAAHAGHVQIHHDDVGRHFTNDVQGLLAGGGLPDDLDALVFQEVAKPTPEEIVIVDDQDADLGQRLIVRL